MKVFFFPKSMLTVQLSPFMKFPLCSSRSTSFPFPHPSSHWPMSHSYICIYLYLYLHLSLSTLAQTSNFSIQEVETGGSPVQGHPQVHDHLGLHETLSQKREQDGEMAHRLRTLFDIAEDPGSVFSTHMAPHKHP